MGMIASDRVFKVLDNPDYIKETGNQRPVKSAGKIEFRNVSFGYSLTGMY